MGQGRGNRAARPAGPFLVAIGATLLVALAAADEPRVPADLNVFLCGMALSFAILFIGARLARLPRPAPVQRVAIVGSIALEFALFALRPHITGPLSPAAMWIAALMIVGIHFIPFAIALGVELALLGACCVANAALAMTGWAPPPVWIGIDALLKIGFGLWIWFRPARRDQGFPADEARGEPQEVVDAVMYLASDKRATSPAPSSSSPGPADPLTR